MKTYCKNIDPTDIKTISPFIWQCLEDKLYRCDYSDFVAEYSEYTGKEIRNMVKEYGYVHTFLVLHDDGTIRRIAEDVANRIQVRNLNLPPVEIRLLKDGMSGKVREIAKESVMQQVIEHIADGCLKELWEKKFAYHQYASVAGKGQIKGANTILKWSASAVSMSKTGEPIYANYFVKLDVHHCYQSISHDIVMKYLRRDIGKNKVLLWFVGAILETHGIGLLIGSVLSKDICNYLMSYAYRYVMGLHKVRRNKSIKMVSFALFYMDDILLMGTTRSYVKRAAQQLILWIQDNLGLTIKPNWHVKDHRLEPIDMMGFVIYGANRIGKDGKIIKNPKIAIRKKIFIRARRSIIRISKGHTSLKLARRCSAYWGYFKHSDIQNIISTSDSSKYDIKRALKCASAIISKHDKEAMANGRESVLQR